MVETAAFETHVVWAMTDHSLGAGGGSTSGRAHHDVSQPATA
jgi:hypothetical protein